VHKKQVDYKVRFTCLAYLDTQLNKTYNNNISISKVSEIKTLIYCDWKACDGRSRKRNNEYHYKGKV